MNLVTQNAASKIPNAPTSAGINKKLKQRNVPQYFVKQGDKIMVDIDHPEWLRLLQKRERQEQKGMNQGSKNGHPLRIKKPGKPGRPKKEKSVTAADDEKSGAQKEKPPRGKKAVNGIDRVLTLVPERKELTLDDFAGHDEDIEELSKASYIANLKEQVLKNDGIHFQNEIKKMSLLKSAKNVISVDYAEFVYFGYMEKINVELLMMTKKLKSKIEARMKEHDLSGILRLIDREHETIIRETKKNQAEDAEKWRAEK